MAHYLPTRKVIAAALMALVATVYLTASGTDLDAILAVWLPVAAAYAKGD